MRRIISILLVLLLLPLCAGRISAGEAEETIVRVRLSTDGADSVTVTLSGQYEVDGKVVTGGTVTASMQNGTITLRHSSAGKLKSSTTSIRLVRVGTDDETTLTFQNAKHGKRTYFGDFVLVRRWRQQRHGFQRVAGRLLQRGGAAIRAHDAGYLLLGHRSNPRRGSQYSV